MHTVYNKYHTFSILTEWPVKIFISTQDSTTQENVPENGRWSKMEGQVSVLNIQGESQKSDSFHIQISHITAVI